MKTTSIHLFDRPPITARRRQVPDRVVQPLAEQRLALRLAPASHSRIELVGRWLAFTTALSLFPGLIGARANEWADLSNVLEQWRYFFVGLIPVVAIIALASERLPQDRLVRWPLLVLTAVAGVALGSAIEAAYGVVFDDDDFCGPCSRQHAHTLTVIAIFITVLWERRRLSRQATAAAYDAEVNRLKVEGEVIASRLQVLQAQIEPHFIFNSLANVRRLLRIDGIAGRAMLADMLRYLESALPRLRDDAPTLGRELELTRAFLAVHQVRMGERLAVQFDVEPALERRPIPPLMLLTLVENALKHGLNPLPEGGAIRVSALSGDDGALYLSVADTGRGLMSSVGDGTGLVNIRTRLRAMFGPDAELTLRTNEPRGVVATLAIPERAPA